ncbi:glycosyltransferase family 2 protein [Bacillus sp. AK031]
MVSILLIVFLSVVLGFIFLYTVVPFIWAKQSDGAESSRKEIGISIVIPAFNESSTFESCIWGLNNINYSNYEVVIANDGSTDDSMEVLHRLLDLKEATIPKANKLIHAPIKKTYQSLKYPNFVVVDKDNGKRADALNAGIEYASKEVTVLTDADSVLRSDSLNMINEAFYDKEVIAAGGTVRILQGMANNGSEPSATSRLPFLVKIQTLGYLRSFLQARFLFYFFGTMPLISGAFGIYRTKTLLQLGGHNVETVGEDMDLTFRAHAHTKKTGEKILFLPSAVCYTECPETLEVLYSQRVRWQKGFLDCFFLHKGLLRGSKFLLTIFVWIQCLLIETFTPIATILLTPAIYFLTDSIRGILLFTGIVAIAAVIQTLAAIIVNRRFQYKYSLLGYLNMFMTSLIEVIVTPFMNSFFVLAGTFMYFRNKNSWGKMKRTGTDYTSKMRR